MKRELRVLHAVDACYKWLALGVGKPRDNDLREYGLPEADWPSIRAEAKKLESLVESGDYEEARRLALELSEKRASKLTEQGWEPLPFGAAARLADDASPADLAAEAMGERVINGDTDPDDPRKLAEGISLSYQ